MLISLNVKNFAIIDNINIDFKDHMTVITGETGAGKSLIIDAIGLLFGNRASNDLIRFGEEKASIIGEFGNISPNVYRKLDEFSISYDVEDNLIIRRDLYANGKSKCTINGEMVTLNQLQEFSEELGDIHSQNDALGLINPKNYLALVNNKTIDSLLSQYDKSLSEYKAKYKELVELQERSDSDTQKLDFLKYQLKELDEADLDVEEEKNLKNELEELNHYEQIHEQISKIKEIYRDDSTLNNLYDTLKSLEELKKFNSNYEELYKMFEESYYNIEAVYEDNSLNIKEFDSDRLDQINERLGLYSDMKRKYKKDVEEIVNYQEEIRKSIYNIDNYDEILKDLKKSVEKLEKETLDIANKITEERKKEAISLTKSVTSNLDDLMLKNTDFEIEFTKYDKFLNNGIDKIDFLVSFNKGEPKKPLSKVASGGELSRFMLALKSVLGSKLPTQVKIFDEIDSGVSGVVAASIANKIKAISNTSQVLCITHLPQVASIGDNHLKISKQIVNGRTFTQIDELVGEERVEEIAKMISNGEATVNSINLAKEMLNKK